MYVLTWSKPSCVDLDADVENFNLYNVDESLNLPLLNESQQKAVEEAMKKPFTVIQGPPGIKILKPTMCVLQYFCRMFETSDGYESLTIQSKRFILLSQLFSPKGFAVH